jgi:uncharacterized membrane protein YfcA
VDGWTVLAVVAVGAGAGFLGGLFGKGGSAVATPVLAAIGIPPLAAVASPLPASVPSMLVSWRQYRRAGMVDTGVVMLTLLAGVPAAAAGAYATRWIDGEVLVVASEVLILALGLRFVLRPGDPHEVGRDVAHRDATAIALGCAVGFVSGLLANTGGFLLAPLFVVLLRLPIKVAFGTSLAVAIVLALPSTVVHAALGHVDWAVAAAFVVGSIPAASFGARCALRTEAAVLERVYGAGLAVLAAALLLLAR